VDIDKRKEITIFGYPIVLESRLFSFLRHKFIEAEEALATGERNTAMPAALTREKVLKAIMFIRSKLDSARLEQAANGDMEPIEGGIRLGNDSKVMLSDGAFLKVLNGTMQFCNIEKQRSGKYDQNIDYIFQSIDEMNELLKGRNIGLLIAIFPAAFQVDEEVRKRVVDAYGMNLEDYDLLYQQKKLIAFLQDRNIPFVDLYEPFNTLGRDIQLYGNNDTHWNRYGNALAAYLLFEEFLKHKDI